MKTITAMELMEMLKQVDPMTPIVIEKSNAEIGWHYKQIKSFDYEVVRMTELRCTDAFDGTPFVARELMSCSIEKPNAFKVLVIG